MKKIIIISSIVLVIGLLIWLYLRSRKPSANLNATIVGNQGPTGSECDPNLSLARPPADKEWVCKSGQWMLLNKKSFNGDGTPYVYDGTGTQFDGSGGYNSSGRVIRLTNVRASV